MYTSAPLSVRLDYDPPFPDAMASMQRVTASRSSESGFSDGSDLIQTVCQIYDTVEGERVYTRKTALIRRGSPLHPYSVCNPNYGGHEQCLPLIVDYVPPEFAPPTMAHHFYYMHIREAQISISLKDGLYRELYHTAPKDLFTKYTHFRSRFDIPSPDECRMLMFAVLNFWTQRCRRLKLCLDATKLFPVRMEWIDPVFEGTKFKTDAQLRSWEGGREVDEYGWAVEMTRAERVLAFTENCPLIFIGDNTSTRLARYIEWGKRLSDLDGRFQRRLENGGFKFEECERMSVLVNVLQKMHFGNGCVAVVVSSGAHELAEGMPPSKYVELLKVLLVYLLQFQMRIIVLPPTPCVKDRLLWFQYLQQQHELSTRLSTVEFLVAPSHQADGRSFLDALIMGNRTLDPYICSDAGFTDFGIKKLGFFLIEVMQIPKVAPGGQTSKRERMDVSRMPKEAVIEYDYRGGSKMEEQSMRFMEAQKQGWYPPSLDYEPLDDAPAMPSTTFPTGMPTSELLPADYTYLNAKSYSELAGYAGPGSEAKAAPGKLSRRNRKKKNKSKGEAGLQEEKNLQRERQLAAAANVAQHEDSKPQYLKAKNFHTVAQERRSRRKKARARRAAEQPIN